MSLGVRFKFCLAIWTYWQVVSPTYGLKMQVTNLSSSPKPLSESDLNINAIGTSQIVNSAKVLPNVPIKRLNSLSSPTNIFEPTIIVPNSLSTPSLNFDNVPRSWNFIGRTLNPQGNVIDAVLVEAIPYNSGINNDITELNGLNQLENIPDLIPSENNIIPSTTFANMFGKNSNNVLVKPSFGKGFTNIQNVEPSNEIIQPANSFNKLNSDALNMHNSHEILPSLNTFVRDISTSENEVLLTNDDRNVLKNIPRIHQSFGPIFNSNLHIPETVSADNKLMQHTSNLNIFNSFSKGLNDYKGNPNLHVMNPIPTKSNTPAVESDAVSFLNNPVVNTIPKRFNEFETNLNTQTIITSPQNFENQPHNANSLNNAYINHQNIATGNFNSVEKSVNNDNYFNNVNQINMLQNQNQFERTLGPQFNPSIELSNQGPDNSISSVNTNRLNNKVIIQNLPPPIESLQINNVHQNSKLNEIAAPPNNMNNFYNTQRLPNINYNDQTFQKDSTISITDNNNNFIGEVPNDISKMIENNEFGMFNQRYPISMSNRLPIKSNTDQISEITFHNPANNVNDKPHPESSLTNQNNNILSIAEAPVTTLASRNPFLNWYKSPVDILNNPITYDKSINLNAQNEIEANVFSQSHHSLNNVEMQPSISTQNLGNFYTLPKVLNENPSSPRVSQVPMADDQINVKPQTLSSFTPKITSVFHNLALTKQPSPETENAKLPFINPELPSGILTSSRFNFPKAELPSVILTPEVEIDKGNLINPHFNKQIYQQKLPIDLGYIPKTNLPPVLQTPEFEIAKTSFVNPYYSNKINSQNPFPESLVGQSSVSDLGLIPSNTLSNLQMDHFSFPQIQIHPSQISVPQSNVVNPILNNAVNLGSVSQVGLEKWALSNPGLLPLNDFEQMSHNHDPRSSFTETSQIVPSNFHNNINPQIVLNAGQPSTFPAEQSSQDIISNVQTTPSNIVNILPNYVGPFTQEQLLHSNYRTPTEVPSSIQEFDIINNVGLVTPTPNPNIGFTPYMSPFNSVFNTIQSVPSYFNNELNNILPIDPIPPQDNSMTPFYHSEPQTIFTENPYSLSSTSVVPHLDHASMTNMVSTQPNIMEFSTPYYPLGLPNEVVNTSPLYNPPSVQEYTSRLNIPSNAQEFVSIPEVTISHNGLNLQNLSPRVAITQELPFISQNSFNQYPSPGFLSSVSHLPNVYTSNAIQQILPAVHHLQPTVSYTNVTPNNLFPQVSELFPTTGIVNSINDAASIVAKNVLTNLISKKLNSKTPHYIPVTNLPPVNPYVPTSFYSTPPAITYDHVIPFISNLPTPNVNSVQYPITSHSYEVFEIPDYYNDDYITDLSTTTLFADIPEIPDIPDMDYDFENEMTPFIPYMSSLKVNILPIIEDVNLEPILPNNILIDAYPNLSPSFLPSTNIPYPIGPQVIDTRIPALQSFKGKKCRDVKDLERLISLFVLSELINGNENCDWDGLEKIIALLCVT